MVGEFSLASNITKRQADNALRCFSICQIDCISETILVSNAVAFRLLIIRQQLAFVECAFRAFAHLFRSQHFVFTASVEPFHLYLQPNNLIRIDCALLFQGPNSIVVLGPSRFGKI